MATQAETFLSALFSDKPEDPYILIWTLQEKKSHWCRNVQDALNAVASNVEKKDIYVGVGLSPEDYGPKQRGLADSVAGIVGLWADVDIADAAHKKTNLPPDSESAQALVQSMGIPPTILIHSGHGLQAWWLFKEPWIFESSEERQEAYTLSMKWTSTLRHRAKEKGWDVDSVFDLARVLRVPGTWNRKVKGAEKPVRIIQNNPNTRYDPSEFSNFIIDAPIEKPASKKAMAELGPLELNEDAHPPFDKFEILREIEPKFGLTWERKRKDFQDQSASTYDLSLATYGAMAGWTDREIVNLVISGRRKHGDDLKLRQDYYQRTIAKAREAVRKQRAAETIEEIAAGSETQENGASEPASKRKLIIDALSAMFGVTIKRIIKYLADQPTYRLETDLGSIMLGEVANLINQNQLRTKMAAACGRLLPKFKGERWENIAQALLDACEDEELGEEATERGQARAWVQNYLEERKPIDDPEQASITKYPFIKDHNVYIFGSSLRQWLVISQGEKVTAKQMGAILRAYDCQPETVYVQVQGKETTRSVWRIPGYIPPEKEEE